MFARSNFISLADELELKRSWLYSNNASFYWFVHELVNLMLICIIFDLLGLYKFISFDKMEGKFINGLKSFVPFEVSDTYSETNQKEKSKSINGMEEYQNQLIFFPQIASDYSQLKT